MKNLFFVAVAGLALAACDSVPQEDDVTVVNPPATATPTPCVPEDLPKGTQCP